MNSIRVNQRGANRIRAGHLWIYKSDLVDIEQRGARHSSDYLAAGSEASFHLSQRAVKRIGCNERDTGPGH